MKRINSSCIILILSAFIGAIFFSQQAVSQEISVYLPNGRNVKVTTVSSNILRIENYDTQENKNKESMVLDIDSESGSGELLNPFCIETTSKLRALVNNNTGAVILSTPDVELYDTGERIANNGDRLIEIYTNNPGSFHGAGERGHSYSLNGDTLVMYNRQNYGYTKGDSRIKQMNITMPLIVSSEGYALLFDDYAASVLIAGDTITYISESRHPISYYFIYGEKSIEKTVEVLSSLTGRQDLPPFWSLGYITSKYGYKTQEETLGVIDTLKTSGYPVDGIVLDLYWYGQEEDMGRLEWDSVQWPDPKSMLDSLKKESVNLITISQPYVLSNGRGIDNYNYLSEEKMLLRDSAGNTHPITIWVGEGGMFDVSNELTREWLKERYKKLTDYGVGGWWGDLGEPEVHPETGFHANGESTREYHNKYGNDWSKIIYDLYHEEYPQTRLMTLMRGGSTGLQRYSVFPWSTDVSRSWGGLQPQITIMLNSGLSGLGYMSHDVGGFAVDPDNQKDDELYVRWLQLGLFSPILRTHAQNYAEPYNYLEYESIIKSLINERYRWLPYNYSLAFENALKGQPLVRAINYYSGDTSNDSIDDEYLWGRDLLVAPVMVQGAVTRDITFPTGKDRWIDVRDNNRIYEGGTTIRDYPAPLEVIPLFVREGAFLPSANYSMQNTGDYRTDEYRIDFYPLDASKLVYTLFEDDLKSTQSILNNEFLQIQFEGESSKEEIDIKITSEGTYKGVITSKKIELIVHGIANTPKSVTINDKEITTSYCQKSKTLVIPIEYDIDSQLNLKIKK